MCTPEITEHSALPGGDAPAKRDGVKIEKLSVSAIPGGAKVCFEVIVPRLEWPDLVDLARPENHQTALNQIRAACPALIPPLVAQMHTQS
jgi:hypothetical protein